MRRLLIRPGAIGDCIVALPALESLKADYTEVWTPSTVVPLIRFADRVQHVPSAIDLLAIPDIEPPIALLGYLRTFDSILSWYGANQPEFRERVWELGLPFEFFPALPHGDCRTHVVDYFLAQAGAPLGAAPRIDCVPVKHGSTVIHPFSGSIRKNWPMLKFRALADRLPKPLAWCVGPHEQLPGAVKIENLYDLACWIAGARLYVGNDGGITHLAAAVGTPVVAIFGPTDPAVWAPRGQNIRVVSGTLENIPVEEVLRAVGTLL